MTKATNLITTGDQFAPKGTQGWADWQRSSMRMAIKDVHFEARQIVGVIREMCQGETPAWQLMTRLNGVGFRTFAEFITAPLPEGAAYPDYAKFRAIAISEPGILTEREFDLLTAPRGDNVGGRPKKGETSSLTDEVSKATKSIALRAISRAPDLVRKLYLDGILPQGLAAMLGPDEDRPGGKERKQQAMAAVKAIKAIHRNGDTRAYALAVRDAVEEAFGRKRPTTLDGLRKLWAKATAKERKAFIDEVTQ